MGIRYHVLLFPLATFLVFLAFFIFMSAYFCMFGQQEMVQKGKGRKQVEQLDAIERLT